MRLVVEVDVRRNYDVRSSLRLFILIQSNPHSLVAFKVYDMDRDMLWRWDQVLKTHPNGMRFSVFGEDGDLLATNEYYRYVANMSSRFNKSRETFEVLVEGLLSMRKRKVSLMEKNIQCPRKS